MSTDLALIGPFIDGHHRAIRRERDGNSEEIHVFAQAGPPTFGEKDSRWDFNVEIPVGPVTFGIRGYIDLASLSIDATFYVKIPIIGTITLGHFKGNLKDGISLEFGVSGILSGKAKIYINGKTVTLDLSATVFGSHYGPWTLPLFDLP